ncbi:DNA primase [Fulvivirga imtechensis AK7]|uniref:DNA primase n=1 Tax=Fulvivirga imtechensis AK7 TaxID=1237149 RepID=L8JI73_9BACT|nr:DNA primase [Fulvivirga imtechensis]ELR68525.1 DNA primase [Fulvivirga imtechensis AK7]
MISQATIQAVKDRVDIEDVVSDYVSLKRKGQNLWACCPFHDEKTPSFSVAPQKGIYKCFGCGKAGDAISFVEEHDGLNYVEAIRYLAQKYGIEIIEDEQSDEQMLQQNERDSLFIVLNYAKDYYKEILKNHDDGRSIGLSYFKERGFTDKTIDKFELGYSLDEWNAFSEIALKNAYSEDLLEKAGLLIKKDDKKYDRFRGRVIFPIHNVTGKVIAFGARTLKKDGKPKYLNSPETEVYHKSKILYGLFQAKQAIRQMDNCYLVEGYTDVISLHQSDIENVVASSGTSLTDDQIRLINRWTENITVLFDGDTAGLKAALRGVDMILEAGLNVRIVVFPAGEDPDSYSRKLGTSEFKKYLKENTRDLITFKAGLFAEEAVKDPLKKAESIKEIVGSIAKIPDPVKRAVYIKETSSLLGIDESVLLTELNKLLITGRRKKDKEKIKESTGEDLLPELIEEATEVKTLDSEKMVTLQERESIRLLINYGFNEIEEEYRLYDYLLQQLEDVEFSTPVYREILDIFKKKLTEGQVVDSQYFISHCSSEIKKEVVDLMTERHEVSPNWNDKFQIFVPHEHDILENVVFTNVLRLKFRVIQKLIMDNLKKMKGAANEEDQDKHFKIHSELKKSEMELAKVLGIVITR